MSGLIDAVTGDGEKQTSNSTYAAPPTAEEVELIKLNTELAKRQLSNLDALAPFQQELLTQSMADLKRQGAISGAIDQAVTPQQQADLAKQDYQRTLRLGPIQEELLQRQLDDVRRGGAATPEQLQSIKEAADAGIAAGSSDIDASTQRGIGLISDELANSRGLRLSDSPIGSEAALLAREGQIQKGSLIKNMRAGEASARLNFPLAASQITSGINQSQQSLSQAAGQFQADLRQRAYQNRLALSGQTGSTGLGMAGVGSGVGSSTLGSLTSVRGRNFSGSEFDPAAIISSYGKLAGGLGGMMKAGG